jgi:hypothetical protein
MADGLLERTCHLSSICGLTQPNICSRTHACNKARMHAFMHTYVHIRLLEPQESTCANFSVVCRLPDRVGIVAHQNAQLVWLVGALIYAYMLDAHGQLRANSVGCVEWGLARFVYAYV